MDRRSRRGRTAWTSGLAADQVATLHETGFRPVSVLFVVRVRKNAQRQIEFCARALSAVESPLSARRAGQRLDPQGPTSRLSSPHMLAVARSVDGDWNALTVDLMRECSRVRAHGILDVRLTATEVDDGRRIRYEATGTAIRDATGLGDFRGFMTHMSAAEFAALLRAGWRPAGMMAGIAVGMRHETIPGRRGIGPAARRNAEITSWSDVFARTRAAARDDLRAKVEAADVAGALLAAHHTSSALHPCPILRGDNRIVQTVFIVSTIVPATRNSALAHDALAPPDIIKTVISVNPPHETTTIARRLGR